MLFYAGALTSKPYAFTARPWELRSIQSVDISDAVGSNIRLDFKETEILRILPRRNIEINESWISDKARFFYDGLKRQRFNSPYMRINGELKKVKWSKIFRNLASLIKVYSFEFNSSRLGILLGSSCDSETFFTARDLSLNFGFSNLGLDCEKKINIDNSSTYSFNFNIKNLESVDCCLLIGTNPRFEASTINLRLRKIYRRGNLKVFSVGGLFCPTYPTGFLGLSSKLLLNFVEGKHPLCKLFAAANNPIAICSTALLDRLDAAGFQNAFRALTEVFSFVFGKSCPVAILQHSPNIVGGFEQGIPSLKAEYLEDLKFLYCIGVETKIVQRILKKKKLSVLVLQDSHGSSITHYADFVLPSTSFVEKASVYYNVEGRPQRTQRALLGPNLARDDWRILRIFSSFLGKSSFYDTHSQVVTQVSKILPSFYFGNSWFSKRDGSLVNLGLDKIKKEKFYFSYLKLRIEDFYMTDKVCKSSRVMAKASHYLRSYFHNYKYLTVVDN